MAGTKLYTLLGTEVIFEDAAGHTLTLELDQGGVKYSITAGKVSEAKTRGKREPGPPIVVETEDGMVSGSISFLIKAYRSTSGAYTPMEFVQRKGRAAGLVSTLSGGAWGFRIKVRRKDPETEAVAETAIFSYCRPNKLDEDPGGSEGKSLAGFEFDDFESEPTIIQGTA